MEIPVYPDIFNISPIPLESLEIKSVFDAIEKKTNKHKKLRTKDKKYQKETVKVSMRTHKLTVKTKVINTKHVSIKKFSPCPLENNTKGKI
jgi:hypothetical protein